MKKQMLKKQMKWGVGLIMGASILTLALTATAQPGRGNSQGWGNGQRRGFGQGWGMGPGNGNGPGCPLGVRRNGNRSGWGGGLRGGQGNPSLSQGCPFLQGQGGPAAQSLTPGAKQAVLEALAGANGEYQAHALYGAIVAKFGPVQPYATIQGAESNHIAALTRQLTKYGIAVPANTWGGKVVAPSSLEAAAKSAVLAEEKNVALYDKMLAQVKAYPDLTQAFQHLQAASNEAHLPAFRAAVANKGQLALAQMQKSGGCCGWCLAQPATTAQPAKPAAPGK